VGGFVGISRKYGRVERRKGGKDEGRIDLE
jgi:hypothetical protein